MSEVGPRPEGGLALSRAALAALEASRQRIDDLNVYPVPDGDTGTNMTLTVRAAVAALERDLAADIGRAVLMGARGNSGVILSQLVAGALREVPEGALDSQALARMLRSASDTGYDAVRNPQEGTILTVARSLAERAEEIAADDVSVEAALADVLAAGEVALAETTEQLDVLKQAGVVDAGGAGLVEIVRGIASHVRGEELPEPAPLLEPIPLEAIHLDPTYHGQGTIQHNGEVIATSCDGTDRIDANWPPAIRPRTWLFIPTLPAQPLVGTQMTGEYVESAGSTEHIYRWGFTTGG